MKLNCFVQEIKIVFLGNSLSRHISCTHNHYNEFVFWREHENDSDEKNPTYFIFNQWKTNELQTAILEFSRD